jgi:diadenosine tetraphosphatase ApaH/serine/threonine PP2A family protein phosphatase
MRCAVISDIHANLEALRSVLAAVAPLRPERIFCLGDLVGYNADPNECVALARREGIVCVLGNHDAAASGLTEPDHFTPAARTAALWTRAALTGENRTFLRQLPRQLQLGGVVLCHGSIDDTDRYLLRDDDLRDASARMEGLPGRPDLCFFGHTHVQIAYRITGGDIVREGEGGFPLLRGSRYLVNPGGAGQPRDGDPRAAFLLYDAEGRRISFRRVEYDIAAAQDRILRAGLPARLAERLARGR